MTDSEHEAARALRQEARIRRRQTIRVLALVVVAVAFAGVALDNTQDVTVGWVLDEARIPLIVALLGSFLAGAVIAAIGVRRRP